MKKCELCGGKLHSVVLRSGEIVHACCNRMQADENGNAIWRVSEEAEEVRLAGQEIFAQVRKAISEGKCWKCTWIKAENREEVCDNPAGKHLDYECTHPDIK